MENLIGYIYNEEGKHSGRIYLDGNPENIARFIARGVNVPRIEITDGFDIMKVTTISNFLNWIDGEEFREELLKYLIPMQMGQSDPWSKPIVFSRGGEDEQEEERINNEFRYVLEKYFNYSI